MKTKKKLTFDDIIVLLTPIKKSIDKDGNKKIIYDSQKVMGNILSVDKNQFYNANIKGYKIDYILTINKFEWNEATKIKIKGKKYEVIRTFEDEELLEITLGEKIGGVE